MGSQTNYQRVLDDTIEKLLSGKRVPTLLLHSCCAPCSSYVLEYLSRYFLITLVYYNPNIFPKEEYAYRISEQKRLIEMMNTENAEGFNHPIGFVETDYTPEDFYDRVKGMEAEPEGGKRCEECFRIRLTHAARLAAEGGFDYFTTTLSISPLKNAALLNKLGSEIGESYGVKYLLSDFKKRNGYKRSVELSKEYGLYRQDYCGCAYSKAEREKTVALL